MEEPPSLPQTLPPQSNSKELQCVGRLEIARPKPVGFLCGSIPVPTDKSFQDADFNSALVPSARTVTAPRYRVLPTETDLNRPPLLPNFPEKVLPIGAIQNKATGDPFWEGGAIASNLSRKCEALAVSGLVEYGDEIDVIAPTDILKQIFKIPYSKARLSISVRRVGQTLVLNTGADIEEGERLVRRHGNQSKCADQSLFLNFAMHSVRMEACDCPPTHHAQSERQSNSSVLPGTESSTFIGRSDDVARKKGSGNLSEYPHVQQDNSIWESKKNKRNKSHDPVKKASHVGEKPRSSIQESEKQRRFGNDGFLRVLFWKFHNFRMLLGSDLLLFSNEKYVAVSLHLWDVTRQVTPLTWLEAWLDNVMASAPELAICYHENGVVQGYELLKTDDIFLLKGVSDDGAPAFHPHVVQQNGLSVLRFLQENCKQDPGAYWLYKGAGEDVIRLFDLSVISKNHASSACDDGTSSVPLIHRGRSDSLFSLGTLLYRIAHRHSLSLASDNRAKCARFIKQCLDFLDEPDQLVVRALAHEQFARLILNYEEDLIITPEFLPVECEITVTDAEEESVDTFSDFSESAVREKEPLIVKDHFSEAVTAIEDIVSETSIKMTSEENISISKRLVASSDTELRVHEKDISTYNTDESIEVCRMSPTSTNVIETVVDPISAKLAAVHHVSQAIKSLRFMRQLQSSESEYINQGIRIEDMSPYPNFSVCACGDADCIEVCDIREWLPTSKLDNKLWKLVLLLGESYLALGQAYKENCQLHQALKTVEKACSVYGSMPQHLEDTKFISSMITGLSSPIPANERSKRTRPLIGDMQEVKSSPNDECLNSEKLSSTYLFWARAWTLVGDVYVEFHMMKGKEISIQAERKPSTRELKMSPEVEKEVQRLKRKLGQYQNCRSCSLVNCSCQSDRASSGSSASSSSENKVSIAYGRKHNKRSHAKSSSYSLLEDTADSSVNCKDENKKCHDSGNLQLNRGGSMLLGASNIDSEKLVESLDGIKSKRVEGSMKPQNEESTGPTQTEIASREEPKMKSGGIFRFLGGSVVGDAENNLSAALSCYEEAIKALSGLPTVSAELQSVQKKKGWVCNEMGRIRLEKKELQKAEFAFANAISAFKEVSDHINIILINCNLGHGRRSLAEEMVSKIESLKVHAILQNVYKQALETAKLEYRESIRYYGAAKLQLNSLVEDGGSLSDSLRMEVHTQFAHTYLRLGMLLAREDTTAEVYEIGAWEDLHVLCDGKTRKEMRKHEITANDSIREALSFYESMGDLRKQEAAFAYFQLACYQRDCCLKYLEVDHKKNNLPKGENSVVQRVKQYASLAERNWQRAIDFYSPRSHATMYLTILLERSTLLFSLSCSLHSNVMLETALSCLLEGCHIPESCSEFLTVDGSEVCAKFWKQLQMLLKRMLVTTASASPNKCHTPGQSISPIRYADAGKLRELYKMSLKSTNFISALQAMHTLWT